MATTRRFSKNGVIVGGAALLATLKLQGGVVLFEPSNIVVPHGSTVTMMVTLQVETIGEFNGVDVLLGSDTAPFSFEFSDAFLQVMPSTSRATWPGHVYRYAEYAGGINLGQAFGPSLELGLVTFDTSNLVHGIHTIEVNWDAEYNGRRGISALLFGLPGQGYREEGLYGVGRFVVAPEPNLLAIFGFAALAIVRGHRRRDAERNGC